MRTEAWFHSRWVTDANTGMGGQIDVEHVVLPGTDAALCGQKILQLRNYFRHEKFTHCSSCNIISRFDVQANRETIRNEVEDVLRNHHINPPPGRLAQLLAAIDLDMED